MNSEIHLCAYCGAPATHQLKNGKWCCQPSSNSCPDVRKKISQSASRVANKTCPHCHQEFQNIHPKVFSNHVRWCKQNPDRNRLSGELFRKTSTAAVQRSLIERFGEIREFTVTCAKCRKQFKVREREKIFPSKEKYYCSSQCSHSREHTPKQRKAASEKTIRWLVTHGKKVHKNVLRNCQHCGEEFVTKENSSKRFCSNKCARRHIAQLKYQEKLGACVTDIERTKLEIAKYREACKFKFSLNQFPDEFDFDLIRKYGWYKAKNHGDNLTGVSRDHMYSVMDGFVNHIDPKILSHPANCKLMIHSENISKHNSSSITLDELLKRIDQWNLKYGSSN